MTEHDTIQSYGGLRPLLESTDPRPYSITRTIHLDQPINGATWAFSISGPGWPDSQMYAGTSEMCGQHFIDGLNVAYKWGVRAGKASSPPFGGL